MLHAGAGFAVTGSDGLEGHRWFANSQVMVNTTLVSYWSDPDDAQIRLFYRFDGSTTATATGAAEAQAYGRVFGSTLDQQALDCLPVDGVPGQCMIVIPGRASGEVFDYGVMLQAITSVAVTPAGGACAGTVEADYRHTLTWTGVELVSEKTGAPLGGWTLGTADDGAVLFSSPVPEPPAALMAFLGLAALAWRRR
jgi:MYXO-CTERM domain-containing protein